LASKKKASAAELPLFLVQHTRDETFVFCVEINGSFQCWSSEYPPSMDPRFKRTIKKGASQPLSVINKENKLLEIWDKGNYSLSGANTKSETEKAFLRGLSDNKLSFSLIGQQLQGRFAIHYERNTDSLLLYKYKDKFAHEEDPLEMELQRSMNKWVPRFDPENIELPPPPKKKKSKPVKKVSHDVPDEPEEEQPEQEEENSAKEEIIVTIKGKEYRLKFYRSIGMNDKEIICLITPADGDPFVMKQTGANKWEISSTVNIQVARQEAQFRKVIINSFRALDVQ
jgi:hypothetical protein